MINHPLITQNKIGNLERGSSSFIKAGVVLHRTVSSTGSSALNNFKTGVGTHFLVDRDGTIYQTASLNKKTSHLRESQLLNSDLSNANTIGIEVVGMPLDINGKPTLTSSEVASWEDITPGQASSVGFLVNSLIKTFKLNNNQIFNHEDIQPKTEGEGGTVRKAIEHYINHENDENQ